MPNIRCSGGTFLVAMQRILLLLCCHAVMHLHYPGAYFIDRLSDTAQWRSRRRVQVVPSAALFLFYCIAHNFGAVAHVFLPESLGVHFILWQRVS